MAVTRKVNDGYGKARDGFRGYARDSWNTTPTGSSQQSNSASKKQDLDIGYGGPQGNAQSIVNNKATNARMQSNLQQKAAARRNALTSKATSGAQAMGTAMRRATGSVRPVAQVPRPAAQAPRPAARPAAQAQAGAARGAQAMAAAMRRR